MTSTFDQEPETTVPRRVRPRPDEEPEQLTLRGLESASLAARDHLPKWKSELLRLSKGSHAASRSVVDAALGEDRRIHLSYRVNVAESRLRDQLVVDFYERFSERDDRAVYRRVSVDERFASSVVLDEDKSILGLLLGNIAESATPTFVEPSQNFSRSVVRPGMYGHLLPSLVKSERFFADEDATPLSYCGDAPFKVVLEIQRAEGLFCLSCRLERDEKIVSLERIRLCVSGGLVLAGSELIRVESGASCDWLYRLHRGGSLEVPEDALDDLIKELAAMPSLPALSFGSECGWSVATLSPRPILSFREEEHGADDRWAYATISFDYSGQRRAASSEERALYDPVTKRLILRDPEAEVRCVLRLKDLGARPVDPRERSQHGELQFERKRVDEIERTLLADGWHIENGEAVVRRAGVLHLEVTSGIDWFDMEGEVDFEGVSVSLPEILSAAVSSQSEIQLPDGSVGLLPEWAPRFAALAAGASEEGRCLRFRASHASIVDALVEESDSANVDLKFEQIRRNFHCAHNVRRKPEPTGFSGKLRDYQREGLGWMQFLEMFRYGGCLADDMGLGKTVQVTALLAARHLGTRKPKNPSLVVVPRSLVFNWIAEMQRFASGLRVRDYSSPSRTLEGLAECDVLVTTYGILRREIDAFAAERFESVILDEAQAIKNPRSTITRCCRRLRANHRLALSGTPVENSLEELWSIFEFLNPGMLGPLDDFRERTKERDEDSLSLFARALAPLILRRTKEEVLSELPPKTELVLQVELEENERQEYERLRDFYRVSLSQKVEALGWENARVHVLEALLRLRQASCHLGLIDPTYERAPSAKLKLLLAQLESVVGSGHKALVFSQFTRLLAIVRRRLEARGIHHAYLDGKTKDRRGVVDAFQNDPSCGVFLISLKAGGCGLNLTSSDYVFILDPWWNPAVEAQAIDRAHRYGQARPVFAYRLIARDTVEEKILALKEEKRRLAAAVIRPTSGHLLKDLTPEDLNGLLS